MYVIEPLLNTSLRRIMRGALKFDTGRFSVPPETATDPCLLYIHVPFCESLCPYCSFHRVVYQPQLARTYFAALWHELALYHAAGYRFGAIYVGGGTPTIDMPLLSETLQRCRSLFPVTEISVETNPNHLDQQRLQPLQALGIDRLSVGVQSFDDRVLRHIQRYDKYGSGAEIAARLQDLAGMFPTLNVDLIFNIPVQTEQSLQRDLEMIETLLPEQVTLYPLMASPAVRATLRRQVGPLSFRREKRFYHLLRARLAQRYRSATVWCFSRQASLVDEYIINYDRYVGVGSGAFGYFNDAIYINSFNIPEYIELATQQQFPVTRVRRFSRRETIAYYVLMQLFGLQLSDSAFCQRFGCSYRQALAPLLPLLKAAGAVSEQDGCLHLTDRGRYWWLMAMREFFVAVDTMRDVCRELAAQTTKPRGASSAG